jgi:hypothetical protein
MPQALFIKCSEMFKNVQIEQVSSENDEQLKMFRNVQTSPRQNCSQAVRQNSGHRKLFRSPFEQLRCPEIVPHRRIGDSVNHKGRMTRRTPASTTREGINHDAVSEDDPRRSSQRKDDQRWVRRNDASRSSARRPYAVEGRRDDAAPDSAV